MNKLFLLAGLFISIFSCDPNLNNEVTISGTISSYSVNKIEFQLLQDNLFKTDQNRFVASIDSLSQFSIKIPVDHLTQARIFIGNTYHEMAFMPGDDLQIEIGNDTISYTGKGAGKNNLLFASEVKWFREQMPKIIAVGDISLDDFVDTAKLFVQTQNELLYNAAKKEKIEPEFKKYFLLKYEFSYPELLFNYSRTYAYKNRIQFYTMELPDEIKKAVSFSNLVKDDYLALNNYTNLIMNLIYQNRYKMTLTDSTLDGNSVFHTLVLDSLKGKTRDHVLTNIILSGLKNNRLDSVLYNKFRETITDSDYVGAVNEAFKKYELKKDIIGKPINAEFSETLLENTNNSRLTFGEMMEKYKGKVVFLDIWSLNCGPCRANMPYSEKVREHLKNQPVEFVYIAQDPPSNDVWEKIFKVTMTKDNQYRMVDYKWGTSKMLKFLEISFVPCYMIFDKEGKLVDYNAEQPSMKDSKGDLIIENRLRKLAEL